MPGKPRARSAMYKQLSKTDGKEFKARWNAVRRENLYILCLYTRETTVGF